MHLAKISRLIVQNIRRNLGHFSMSAIGIIPARWGSTRFPGKVLAPIAGEPMIRRVYEGARTAKRLRDVWVATDDERVADVCRGFGARVAMTSPDCATGTERLAEVCRELHDDVVVNVQGDEPLRPPAIICSETMAAPADRPGVVCGRDGGLRRRCLHESCR